MEKKQEEKNTEKVKKRTSLKNIIGGDILATDFFRRQAGLLFLIMVLIIIYINNRYECQLQLIEIDNRASRNTSPPKKAICRLPLIHRTY